MKVLYSPTFVRMYKKLSNPLKEEVKERIALFEDHPDHPFLKTHKLKGKLKGRYSFSVNYAYRIVFKYLHDDAVLLAVGDHRVYQE